MTKKDHQPKASDRPDNNRRDFLKTGATAVGSFLLGSASRTTVVSAEGTDKSNLENVQFLFVQNARDVAIDDGRLTLIGVNPTTIFFADRPERLAGHMTTEDFILDWQEGTGKESFHADPPNATLSIFGQDEIVDLVVTLKNPRLSAKALVYEIDVLETETSIPSGPASLFIDPIGMPLSPTSVAGVNRRHRRRRRRRIRHIVR